MINKKRFAALSALMLAAPLFYMLSCADDDLDNKEGVKDHNLILTRAGDTAVELVPSMRLFSFNEGVANDKMFHKEVLNIARTSAQLTAKVDEGTWNMAMVSFPEGTPTGGDFVPPVAGTVMANLPMYKYSPAVTGGRSANADQLYFVNQQTPEIVSGTPKTMNVQLNRTVAKVELIIRKATKNFNTGGAHTIKLNNVPSTISYTGALLSATGTPASATVNPAILASPLEAAVTLQDDGSGNWLKSEPISFIIPAHRGDAFTSATPTDTIGLKMMVSVQLERTAGGSFFTDIAEIPFTAKCNKILRVYIDVNDGVEFKTEVLDWAEVPLSSTLGAGYNNWLYVKKGATGNGLSWSDALRDISTAITSAKNLMADGKTVNGILVAGGTSLLYEENLVVPADVCIFGGWEGTPNTELSPADVTGPYTSTFRKLATHKAAINGSVTLSAAGAALDGFTITGDAAVTGVEALLSITEGTAYANAVEITGNSSIASGKYALHITAGTASNILCAQNKAGIYVSPAGSSPAVLLNATVAENEGALELGGADVINSMFWNNGAAIFTPNTIVEHSAFTVSNFGNATGTINFPINANNTVWFTPESAVPGPHFDLGTTGRKRYEAGTDKPSRAPMLRRGLKTNYDNYTPLSTLADQYKTDIDGKPRYHTSINGTTQVVDMGCYEDGSHEGFQLLWATDRVYVSSKGGYSSQMPLLIPANEDPDINIGVKWSIAVAGGSLIYTTFTGPSSGQGQGVMVGTIGFQNSGSTPAGDYGGNAERQLGTITISSNLGNYLPNEDVQVWQTMGTTSRWSTGYVGSFHRYNERGARYISGTNIGEWSVRIIAGLDWIKIDDNNKDYGDDITDVDEGKTPSGGYYKEVTDTWGGAITHDQLGNVKSGNIKFRVGMKSKNTTGSPRYGLIVVTRSGGMHYFFVRQGEDPDYVYTKDDVRPTYGTRNTAYVKKFSPYNITDPAGRVSTTGTDLGMNGGTFTKYPTQIGYYFKWNQTIGHLYGSATSLAAYSRTLNSSSTWSTSLEVCPPNYIHPSHIEYINSIYYDVNDTQNGDVSPTGTMSLRNYEWGAYADGWYDQLVSDPIPSALPYDVGSFGWVSSGTTRAGRGTLMVSHNNYAAVFFPASSVMPATNSGTLVAGNYYSGFALYFTRTFKNASSGGTHIHFSNAHIGMNCTPPNLVRAVPVRCILNE